VPGLVVAPLGHLHLAVKLVINDGLITDIDVIADPERLVRLAVAVR
jgi:RNA polymerase sigma-70 factor, ECF subfamily